VKTGHWPALSCPDELSERLEAYRRSGLDWPRLPQRAGPSSERRGWPLIAHWSSSAAEPPTLASFKDLRVAPSSRTKLLLEAGQGVERPIHQLEELLLPCGISEGLKWRSRPAAVALEWHGIGKLLVALDPL
jgi:hypothetical protein